MNSTITIRSTFSAIATTYLMSYKFTKISKFTSPFEEEEEMHVLSCSADTCSLVGVGHVQYVLLCENLLRRIVINHVGSTVLNLQFAMDQTVLQ